MPRCKLCGKYFKTITNTHLSSVHKVTLKRYNKRFKTKNCGFSVVPNLLPKDDPRYNKWRESLKKRPPPWCKGYTKETHPSILKISKTLKRKKIDNFAEWRKKMIREGIIKVNHPPLERSGDLAELIGMVLGDGHIGKFPRTEQLTIVLNSNNRGLVDRCDQLIKNVFDKDSNIYDRKSSNCTQIRIYQKNISKRLGVPTGARKYQRIKIPYWILKNKEYLKRYLRGLYGAEGSFCIHKPTYTYKFIFVNRNESLLDNVFKSLKILGFHPHRSEYKIQISKKEEVYKIKDLINFRNYTA